MKKLLSLCCILISLILLTGCQMVNTAVPALQTQSREQKELKDSMSDLAGEKNPELKIKRLNGGNYKATPYFAARVVEMLERNSPLEQGMADPTSWDIKLSFAGYKDICMDTQNGRFWFDGENRMYGIDQWSDRYWNRCVLKEINGEVMVASFERDIIEQSCSMDVNGDGKNDDVELYYDGDIRLKIKDEDLPVLLAANGDAISSIAPGNQYICHLYIRKDPTKKRCQFMAGITYSFTNKYGSTSWLVCYQYQDGKLEKTWSSDGELQREIKVGDYQNGALTLHIGGQKAAKKILLDRDEMSVLQNYKKDLESKNEKFDWDKISFLFLIMPQYTFYDYDKDGEDELITRTIVGGGPCLSIGDSLYSIYEFTGEGIILKDSFFGSYNHTLTGLFF
ncbi:MAG: hypothetical protein QHH06_04035 [Clostridiales bacterium]|nr:hypothetical protein [Eubacteriales bacterium]MDH7565636.1 hypothetical protein [Clostridiales bacterium]